jgi:hypothetical protein
MGADTDAQGPMTGQGPPREVPAANKLPLTDIWFELAIIIVVLAVSPFLIFISLTPSESPLLEDPGICVVTVIIFSILAVSLAVDNIRAKKRGIPEASPAPFYVSDGKEPHREPDRTPVSYGHFDRDRSAMHHEYELPPVQDPIHRPPTGHIDPSMVTTFGSDEWNSMSVHEATVCPYCGVEMHLDPERNDDYCPSCRRYF